MAEDLPSMHEALGQFRMKSTNAILLQEMGEHSCDQFSSSGFLLW
jgi:hypothetical protein